MVQVVGVALDVALEPGELEGDALVTGGAALTAAGLHHDPLEQHGAGGGGALVCRLVTVGAPGGAVGHYGVSLRVIILTTCKKNLFIRYSDSNIQDNPFKSLIYFYLLLTMD